MPSPGEYSPREQRFINWLGVFAIVLILGMMGRLLWACYKADFSGAVEYRQNQSEK